MSDYFTNYIPLLDLINSQLNGLLEGTYDYRSVARLVSNLAPSDSKQAMAAKLALGTFFLSSFSIALN